MERVSENKTLGWKIIKTPKRDGFYYQSGEFEYVPTGWAKIENRWYPLGYRVTTLDNKSLGLDRNLDILTYKLNEWVGIPKSDLIPDIKGRGGVWTAINKSDAWSLQNHCLNTWNMRTRVYYAAVFNPVFATSYRVKSEKIMLLEELH